jgi:hypothetical protein
MTGAEAEARAGGMSSPHLVLVPSPVLGPSVWQPVAAVLAAGGWDVSVIPRPPAAPRDAGEVLDHLLGHIPADRPVVLVPHSNAGLYVPALTAARDVVAAVLVDAALPPASGRAPLAPPELLGLLEELADADGLLPPWTAWWSDEQLRHLFADAAAVGTDGAGAAPATRAAVEADQHRLSLEYFRGTVPVPAGWATRPAAYLAFGDTYAPERARAARWGWPVRTLRGGHLHLLVDPPAVAAAVVSLLREVAPGVTRPAGSPSR